MDMPILRCRQCGSDRFIDAGRLRKREADGNKVPFHILKCQNGHLLSVEPARDGRAIDASPN